MAKSLDAKTIDTIADSVKNAKNISKADYVKSLDILKAAGKDIDEVIGNSNLILKGTNYTEKYA